MPEFKTIKEVEAKLAEHVPIVKQITGKDITLQRIAPLMKQLGHPEQKLKIIHVAGTSGKTSTCYYLSAMLQASVGKVGLTVSPHIDTLTERLQINGLPVEETEFCRAFSEFVGLIEGIEPEPSYFELVIALAFWYFHKVGVNYAVIETGMGGSHDASNIAQNRDKICVITDIGLDHTKFLGDKLSEISAQKAGIIHPGNRVFMYQQAAEVTDVFRERAEAVGGELFLQDQSELAKRFANENFSVLPDYQERNWLLARQVYQSLADSQDWQVDPGRLAASLQLQVPGRMDQYRVGSKTVIMDGAHNEQKMIAFTHSFQKRFPGRKADVLLAMKEGKEYESVLPLLRPLCKQLIITTFDVVQDLPAHSIKPEILAEAARAKGFQDVKVITGAEQAYAELMDSAGELAIITGSFYLLSALRPIILGS